LEKGDLGGFKAGNWKEFMANAINQTIISAKRELGRQGGSQAVAWKPGL
jgi:hypothetical protein